jgi:hypothetical protein
LSAVGQPPRRRNKCELGQFVCPPAGNQHEAVAPNGAVLFGFFLMPIRFP